MNRNSLYLAMAATAIIGFSSAGHASENVEGIPGNNPEGVHEYQMKAEHFAEKYSKNTRKESERMSSVEPASGESDHEDSSRYNQ